MTDFLSLYTSNRNNTTWPLALRHGFAAGRVIAVGSAKHSRDFLRAQRAGPGLVFVSNDEVDFAWTDGAHDIPISEQGAISTMRVTLEAYPPPFRPEGAIVWLSRSHDIGRRYWITWPVGTAWVQHEHFSVDDIT